jgi:hypothetical protein
MSEPLPYHLIEDEETSSIAPYDVGFGVSQDSKIYGTCIVSYHILAPNKEKGEIVFTIWENINLSV